MKNQIALKIANLRIPTVQKRRFIWIIYMYILEYYITYHSRLGSCTYAILCNTVRSQYKAIVFLCITKVKLTRKGEVWGVVREIKPDQYFVIVIAVLCTLSYHIKPPYIENLWYHNIMPLLISLRHKLRVHLDTLTLAQICVSNHNVNRSWYIIRHFSCNCDRSWLIFEWRWVICGHKWSNVHISMPYIRIKADSRFAPSQWLPSLQSNGRKHRISSEESLFVKRHQ